MSLECLIDASQLKVDTSFGEHNFDDAVQEQAGLVAHYGTLHAKAEKQAALKKLALEALEAKIDQEVREKAVMDGTKISEAMVDKAIKRDPRYVRASMVLIEAREVESLSKVAMRALADKRDMLIQTGSDRRKEMDGTLRIMAREANDERSKALRERALSIAAGKSDLG